MANKNDLSIFEDMISQNRRALNHLLEQGVPQSVPVASGQDKNTSENRPSDDQAAMRPDQAAKHLPQKPGRDTSARLEARSGNISFTFRTGGPPA